MKGHSFVKFRRLVSNPFFSIVNIGGLSVGLASCILILFLVKDETSFDQFHKNGPTIYQLTCHRFSKTGEDKHFAIAAMEQGPAFKGGIPEIRSFVRVNAQPVTVKTDKLLITEQATWTDPSFFKIFSFPLLSGDPMSVLRDNHSIVVTESTAKKYFGPSNAVGKTIEIEIEGTFRPFIIQGVAKDPPENSSIQCSLLLPFSKLEEVHPDNGWMWVSYPTYFLMDPKAKIPVVEAKMNRIFKEEAAAEISLNQLMGYTDRFDWGLQPFLSMHLQTGYEGNLGATDPLYTFLLIGIAIFILGIACINFINLSVALSMKRSREIGLRKVIGASRFQLIKQLLAESTIICSLAFGVAISIVFLVLPFFNDLAQKRLSLGYLLDARLLVYFLLLFTLTILVTGFYPAWKLSGISPMKNMAVKMNLTGNNYAAMALVVLQFGLASLLMFCTVFIYRQFNFLTTTDLGYDNQDLIQMTIPGAIMDPTMARYYKTAFAQTPGVAMVSIQNVGKFGGKTICNKSEINATYLHVDETYVPTLKIKILTGRNFSPLFQTDSAQSVLVNESFVKASGLINPIGSTIDYMNFPGWGVRKITIIGVVRDYHWESLKEKIKPLVLTEEPGLPLGQFLIKINPGYVPKSLKALSDIYGRMTPMHPFEYSFKKDLVDQSYSAEARMKKIIGIGAIITICISAVGLFGLASLSITQRTKEIGIRKLLGSGILQICIILTRKFMTLVILSVALAILVAWWSLNRWLQNFAYRTDLSPWIFAGTGVIVMLIAIVTLCFQSVRAARMNPVIALRTT